MTNHNDDFTSRGWLVAAATLAVLILVSFIPPIEAGGVSLRRASIISDLVKHDNTDTSAVEVEAQPEINVEDFEVDLEVVAEQVAQTTATASPFGEGTSASWEGIFDEQPSGGDTDTEDEPLPSLEALLVADYSDILPADSLITQDRKSVV